MKNLVEVSLTSTEAINTPGVLRWAINGYAFPKDRKALVNVLMEGYNLTKQCAIDLLSRKVPYRVEDEAVIFTYPKGQYLRHI